MDGSIQIYYGGGRGKTTAVLGLGIEAAGIGKSVIMVQFMKSKHADTLELLKRLEPELQIFRFEKAACSFRDLSPEEKREQVDNIKNALGYTRKVLGTGQCDLLILDGIFGLVDYGIISCDELKEMIMERDESMDLILTGRSIPDGFYDLADCVYSINTEKETSAQILRKEG